MDILLICKDGEESSVLTNAAVAMDAVKAGKSAAILFTGGALAGLAGRGFQWPQGLNDRGARSLIARSATALGYPFADEQDGRMTDVTRLLKSAKEAGVQIRGCPVWGRILGVDGAGDPASGPQRARPGESSFWVTNLPGEVTTISKAQMLDELQSAKTIVGGF